MRRSRRGTWQQGERRLDAERIELRALLVRQGHVIERSSHRDSCADREGLNAICVDVALGYRAVARFADCRLRRPIAVPTAVQDKVAAAACGVAGHVFVADEAHGMPLVALLAGDRIGNRASELNSPVVAIPRVEHRDAERDASSGREFGLDVGKRGGRKLSIARNPEVCCLLSGADGLRVLAFVAGNDRRTVVPDVFGATTVRLHTLHRDRNPGAAIRRIIVILFAIPDKGIAVRDRRQGCANHKVVLGGGGGRMRDTGSALRMIADFLQCEIMFTLGGSAAARPGARIVAKGGDKTPRSRAPSGCIFGRSNDAGRGTGGDTLAMRAASS